jgi:flagella basal body P-ring formation protein FlgA
MFLPFLFALSVLPEGCHTIQSHTILARDVAAVIPAFSKVAADFSFGFVPGSGAPRIVAGADLKRIAKNQGMDLLDAPDICFALKTFIPQPEEIAAAIRKTFSDLPNIQTAKIEISSFSQHPAPLGELIFPRSGLQFPSGTQPEALWTGYVRHPEGDFPVWARVRITVPATRVVAATNIPMGKPIQRSQVRLENGESFPLDETSVRNLDEVIGYVASNALRANFPILRAQVSPAPDVAKGELIEVQVFAGAAHLVVKGKAQADGVAGSTILVRNLSSGKDFSARVTGKNQAVVGDMVQ